MDVILLALSELLTVHHFVYLLGGVAIGMIVGILPGMGGVAGMALLLPFIYGMEPTSALALMIGMLATTATGDTFPSILMGIPGGSSSATIIDGFPMAKKGHAARALAASFTASMLGGILGAVVLTACVFVAKPLILAIGMGEQLLLFLFALTMVGSLTGKSPLKGIAMCGIGVLVGTMGSAPATGETRFSFDTVYLSDGIPLIVLALGIFAMPEIVDLMRRQSSIAETPKLGSGWLDGVRDAIRNWWLVLRVSGIGAVIGILPGVGASTADWLAYGHVVQSSRDRSQFGKGDVRGVIAPEAANNAVRGGDLVPTLFFGIPGSGSMALLLGAFILIGIQPGVRMISTDLDLTYVIIWSLALANIFGAILCIALAGPIARLTLVRYSFLAPLIIVLLYFTAYQATRSWGDVLSLLVISIIGIYFKRFDWPRPALLVGFVLAPGLESSIYQTAQVYGFSFLYRPQALLIAALVVASAAVGVKLMMQSRKEAKQDLERALHDQEVATEGAAPRVLPMITTKMPQIVFTGLLVAVVAYALSSGLGLMYLSQLFPVSVAAITLIPLAAILILQITAKPTDVIIADGEQEEDPDIRKARPSKFIYIGWFALFLAMVWVLGFTIAATIFVVAFVSVECGGPARRNILFGVGTVAVLTALSYFLYLEYPEGYVNEFVSLPWWLH